MVILSDVYAIKEVTVKRGYTIQVGNHFVKSEVVITASALRLDEDEDKLIDAVDELADRKALEALSHGAGVIEEMDKGEKDTDATRK